MIRGFYTSTAGMIAQQRQMDMLSNNLNNIDTPGYKQDQGTLRTFPEMLIHRLGGDPPQNARIGDVPTGVYQDETIPDFTQGTLIQTGKSTDVALITSQLPINPQTGAQDGALLFNVRTPAGALRYTRNGHFTLSPAGQLTDANGDTVLNTAGRPIQLPSDQFQVAPDGTITVNGAAAGQIGVSYAASTNQLVKQGNGLFRTTGATLPAVAGRANIAFQIRQGYMEGANVNAEQTMTDMMEAYRVFEANQKMMLIEDNALNQAVTQVGRNP